MTAILGINAHHADSAACLVVDGRLRAAVAEERLGERLKHSPRFPENAVRSVLEQAGLGLRDVSHVAIARRATANLGAKARYVLSRPHRSLGAVAEHLRRNRKGAGLAERLAEACGVDAGDARFQVVNVEHHLAHVASAYYLSPFDGTAAGLSYDASGDFASLMAARCEGGRIQVLDRVCLPHSLGFFYTGLCQLIGFDEFGEEYKVMGLAPYGEDRFAPVMRELVAPRPDGWFALDTACFGMHEGGESGALERDGRIRMGRFYTGELLRRLGPARRRGEPIEARHKDIARSCQARFEEVAVHCLARLHRLVPTESLVMAGGCSLNGVANARILRDTPFRRVYLQAAASDDGTCLGAAYHVWHAVLGRSERFHMAHAFWGPGYPDSRLRLAAEGSGFAVECHGDAADAEGRAINAELVRAVAGELVSGKVVGWFQGRGEWGPRALGNRSILANPCLRHMKDLINAKIKRREAFRPFAPSVLRELVGSYFEQDVASPFMMHVVKIRPEWRERLPAVTHVDGTGRLQSVAAEENPLYHALIEEFRRRTGVGALLNTSFNENEPIVDTPEQALDCFKRSELDVLVLGRYVLRKPPSS
jgi:carbamoyltransferase